MSNSASDARPRRFRVRKSWERLRQSERLGELLEEFLLWTAVWTGFPVADELRSKDVTGSGGLRNSEQQGLRDRLTESRDEGRAPRSDGTLNGTHKPSPESPACGYPA
jgi:hypothetical protein